MLDSLITSKTRIKLLMKFFINNENTGYLRNLADEFGESTNGIRQELNRLEDAHLLQSKLIQNKKLFKANTSHPYYNELHHLLLKYVGIDQIVDEVVSHVGSLERAYIINDFAQGKPGNVMDLLLVGNLLDETYLDQLVKKAETNVSFAIRYTTVKLEDLNRYINDQTCSLLVWSASGTEPWSVHPDLS